MYLAMYNALYVSEMNENLVPPFVIRRQGHKLLDVLKIHVEQPTENDHCLMLDDDRKIKLQLYGIVSYFNSRKPSQEEYYTADASGDIVDLIVNEDSWNPHDERYALEEECMLDFEGNIIPPEHQRRELFMDEDYPKDVEMVAAAMMDSMYKQNDQLDEIMVGISSLSMNDGEAQSAPDNNCYDDTPLHGYKSISCTLDINAFAEDAVEQGMEAKYKHALNSTVIQLGVVHAEKSKGISAEDLAKVFRIDLRTAKSTLKATSQRQKRSKTSSLHRRYSSNDRMLWYHHLREFFYMDTMFATKKSGKTLRGHSCMQLFVTDKGFVHVVPMKSKSEVHLALKEFFKKIGVPDAIICDDAKEQILGESRKVMREAGTTIRALEPGTPWSNCAERYIGIFKQGIQDIIRETDCPMVLWDFCAEYKAKVNNSTAKSLFQLHGRTPYETLLNEEPDISNLCQFKFYDWCYYYDHSTKFPYPSELLGRVLGPSDGFGNEMCQWILRVNGRVIPRQTVRPLTIEELASQTEVNKRAAFDLAIKRKLGNSIAAPEEPNDDFESFNEDEHTMPETDGEDYDNLVNVEVLLPHQDKMMHATVVGRHVNSDGNEMGRTDANPVINMAVYDVMFPDGAIKQYAANVIVDNVWAQVDQDGNHHLVLDCIVDHHRTDQAIDKADQYIVTKRG